MRLAPLALVVLVACGSSSTTPEGDGRTGGGDVPPSCSGFCNEGDRCTNGSITQRCVCTLHHDVNCGGIDRELDPPTWQWSCRPIDDAGDRGDGCPFVVPASGGACATEGQRCEYGEDPCGWEGTAATCAGGSWAHVPYAYPPPP